jgi:hypothetical protein
MKQLKKSVLIVALASLVGCASMKTELTSAGYKEVSEMLATTHMCVVAGLMDPETAAFGRRLSQRAVNNYLFDANRLDQDTRRVASEKRRANPENCNGWALKILDLKSRHGDKSTSPRPTYMPRTTTCNTYFGQTHCTSY